MYSNIKLKTLDDFKNAIKTQSLQICVIGIGRIGLPTALSFADSGLNTVGVDINSNLVNLINSGEFPLKDEPGYDKIFDNVIKNKKFYATTKLEETLAKTDVIILSLPTPMSNNNIPDYSALMSVSTQLHDYMKQDTLVIVESTVEPSFIETDLIKTIEGSDQKLIHDKNFLIGVCPETANPGEILNDFKKLPRLVGATSNFTADLIMQLYKHVFHVDVIKMSDCKTANAVKLTTNVFRDINIAFINELSILFEKLGIDTLEVLEAAKTKYNFQVHYPGAGVGGPCLPVNSYQMLNIAKKYFDDFKIVRSAREINEHMPDHVIDLVKNGFDMAKKSIDNSTILILGVSYKPNVKDIQLSPAEEIIKKLQDLKLNVKVYDPHYKSTDVFGIKTENELSKALSQSDAVVIVTAHDEFKDLEPIFFTSKMKIPILIDTRGIIDINAAKNAGIIFLGLGRGI